MKKVFNISKLPTPTFAMLLKNPSYLFAFGFGSGLSPYAPGTCGTVVGVIIYAMMARLPWELYSLLTVFMCLIGIWFCQQLPETWVAEDHGGIVWDEICGYCLAMAFVPFSIPNIILGFIAFRAFDILKPWPIKKIEHVGPPAVGIMLDDLVAALYAAILIGFYNYPGPIL